MSTPTPSPMIAAEAPTFASPSTRTAPESMPVHPSSAAPAAPAQAVAAVADAPDEDDLTVSLERAFVAHSARPDGPMVTFHAPDETDIQIADVEFNWATFASPELHITRVGGEPPPPYNGQSRGVRFRVGDAGGLRALGDVLHRLADADDAERGRRAARLAPQAAVVEFDVRPAPTASTDRAPQHVPRPASVPAVDYTVHRATAYAEVSATNGAEVSLGRSHSQGAPGDPEGGGALLVDLEAHGFRFVGSMTNGRGAAFECDDPNAVRSLAAALLGALAEAERVGVLPTEAAAPGAAP